MNEKHSHGSQYKQDAIDHCIALYCKYGGKSHDLIERGMQQAGWTGWRKAYLYDKGKIVDGKPNRNYREGWISKYGFDNFLAAHTEKLVERVNDDEQSLYIDIKAVRKRLGQKALSGDADKDDLAKYRDYCKLEIEARRNLDLSRDNFETFVLCYEKLVIWAPDIDPNLAKLLAKNGDRIAELAQAHYGKENEIDNGAEPGTDESGDEPAAADAGP